MIYIQTKQSVFPKSIYIGDKAELYCSFKSDAVLTTGSVSTLGFSESLDFSVYDIKDVSIQPGQPGESGTYNLKISFVPWKTGVIQLPDFEIEGVGTVHFEGIQILSLVEQQEVTALRSYSSPLLLPGTTYKIYVGIAVLVILLILLIRLIVKWRSVVFWFKNAKLKIRYSRSKKNTIRALKKLLNEAEVDEPSRDSQICTKMQKIIREYLELRLNYPFTKKLTSEMNLAFEEATCGLADENRSAAFENIIAAFVRTDYIRFSDSVDARFEKGELQVLINNLIDDIEAIESENNKEKEEGGKDA